LSAETPDRRKFTRPESATGSNWPEEWCERAARRGDADGCATTWKSAPSRSSPLKPYARWQIAISKTARSHRLLPAAVPIVTNGRGVTFRKPKGNALSDHASLKFEVR
jgi:hypothetical protein